MKRISVFLVALWCATSMIVAASLSLRVQPITGKAQQEVLSAIGKMVYHGDSLYVLDHMENILYREALSNVRRVDYTEEGSPATSISSTESPTATLTVYPNPTQGLLMVQHAEGNTVHVYDAQGKQLLTAALQDGEATMDVSMLPAGTYLLLVQNGVFRFIKE